MAAEKLWMKDGEFLFHYDIMTHTWSKTVIVAHTRFEIIEHELCSSGESIALIKTQDDEYIDLEELLALITKKFRDDKSVSEILQDEEEKNF